MTSSLPIDILTSINATSLTSPVVVKLFGVLTQVQRPTYGQFSKWAPEDANSGFSSLTERQGIKSESRIESSSRIVDVGPSTPISPAYQTPFAIQKPDNHTCSLAGTTGALPFHPKCGRNRDKTVRTTGHLSPIAWPSRRPLEPCTVGSANNSGWSTRRSPSSAHEPRLSSRHLSRAAPRVDAPSPCGPQSGGPRPGDHRRGDRRHQAVANCSYRPS